MGPGRAAAGGGGGNGGGGRSGGMAGVNKVLTEEEKLFHPCFEAYANGAWWEVEILQRMPLAGGAEKFLIQYVGLKDEESESREWVSLDFLRLRARQADSWDCQILTRGVDVSVCGVPHPQAGQLRTPSNTVAQSSVSGVWIGIARWCWGAIVVLLGTRLGRLWCCLMLLTKTVVLLKETILLLGRTVVLLGEIVLLLGGIVVLLDAISLHRDTLTKYTAVVEKTCKQLHQLIAESLGLPINLV